MYSLGVENSGGDFTVQLRSSSAEFNPDITECTGYVKSPKIVLPESLRNDGDAIALMRETGKVFELKFNKLEKNTKYMMRLVFEPLKLITDFERTNIPDPDGSRGFLWDHPLEITAPTSLASDTKLLLDHLTAATKLSKLRPAVKPAVKAGALQLSSVLDDNDPTLGKWELCTIRRHRIFLVFSTLYSVTQDDRLGRIDYIGPGIISDGDSNRPLRMMEWSGGGERFWNSDGFGVAQQIMLYMYSAHPDPKSKEDVVAGLPERLRLATIELILAALVDEGLLSPPDKGQYELDEDVSKDAEDFRNGKYDEKLERVAAKGSVAAWPWNSGFQVKYTFRYPWESPEVKQRKRWIRLREELSFATGIIGFILGVIGLGLSLAGQFGNRDGAIGAGATVLLLGPCWWLLRNPLYYRYSKKPDQSESNQ